MRLRLHLPTLPLLFYIANHLAPASSSTTPTFQPSGTPFKAPITLAPGFTASTIFSNLTSPRGIAFDSSHNLLVVERGVGVTAFTRVSQPTDGWERTVVVQNAEFTQGIQVDGSRLYVSTAGDTFQYVYDASLKSVSSAVQPFSIVTGIPPDGDLTTHTLQLERDSAGKAVAILIASGPKTNIDLTARDPSSGRSQIRRFPLQTLSPSPSAVFPPPPMQWSDGQIIAFGIRNPAGFAFPPNVPALGAPPLAKSLVVVENGASIDNATGLTGVFVNDNPADELELVLYSALTQSNGGGPLSPILAPKSFGFPDCTTLWNGSADPVGDPQFVGKPRGTQFSLLLDPGKDDEWCQVKANNEPPILSFAAHSVPLDIKFYTPQSALTSAKAFPSALLNHAFVSFHGSFNRSPPTGYGVVQFPFPPVPQATSLALGYTFIIQAANLDTCPGSCIRPVGLAFGTDGRLYVSSDSSGEVFVLEKA